MIVKCCGINNIDRPYHLDISRISELVILSYCIKCAKNMIIQWINAKLEFKDFNYIPNIEFNQLVDIIAVHQD